MKIAIVMLLLPFAYEFCVRRPARWIEEKMKGEKNVAIH